MDIFPPAQRTLLASAVVLGSLFAWWAQRGPRLVGKPCPWLGTAALGAPLLFAHLMLNRLDFTVPPAAGLGWLAPLTILWMLLTLVSQGLWHASPHRVLPLVPAGITLTLASLAFGLCQARLPWLFSPGESEGRRFLLSAAVVAGGVLLSGGTGRLAVLLPAWGFWFGLLALTAPLALAVGLGNGPVWLSQSLWILPAVCVGNLIGSVAGGSATPVPVPVGLWAGVAAGLPFLWFCVSRTPAAPAQLPVLVALAPAGVAIVIEVLARRVHPAALALLATALLLLAGSAVLHFSSSSLPPPVLLLQEGDDSGAYE